MNRTTLIVICVHISLFSLMAIFAPKKKVKKEPLLVKTVVQLPPVKGSVKTAKAAPAARRKKGSSGGVATKKVAEKKRGPTRAPAPAQPQIPPSLLRDLQESIAKIDQRSHKGALKSNLKTPKSIPKTENGIKGDQLAYANELVACLKKRLTLPEFGEVKIELLIQNNGVLKGFRVLSSKSDRNRHFLESELGHIYYPPFSGSLKSEKEHPFVIAFSNH